MTAPARPTYKAEIRPAAFREIKKLAKVIQQQVIAAVESLTKDPRPNGCKKLGGHDLYRILVGKDHRLVYAVEDQKLIIIVVIVGNRKDVYRSLVDRKLK